ncbi:hypothetical protein BDN72DRAFT_835572, partial [Pluteus cervinus]
IIGQIQAAENPTYQVGELPAEVLLEILQELAWINILRARQVCKEDRAIREDIDDPSFTITV